MTNKRCLVFETLGKVSDLQIVEKKADDGLMRLSGVFGVCGVKNNNNRIYDQDNYRQMVESLQQVIKESGCPGELEHPNSMNINLENVSHKIEEIQMNEDGTITGTIVLLNTPKGQIAQAIVEGGLPLFISSRAAGTMTNESGVSHVTLSTIKTYDLVGTPGFSQAKLTLKENQTLECLNESVEDENQIWAIVEGDDVLSDDSDDDKDKDKKGEGEGSDDDKDKDKKEGDDKDKDGDKDDKDDKDKENNKNIDNTKVNMKDLKEAIDKLTDKVTSLEAELHVAQESLNETKSSIPVVNYDAIQKWVTEEFGTDFKDKLVAEMKESFDQSSLIEEKVNEAIESIANCVQSWVLEEFAPEVQNWVVEEFAPEVQGWITEEFAPVVDSWINEEFAPEHMQNVENKVNENVSAFLAENKAGRLEEIDSLLETIEGNNSPLDTIVKENNEENKWKGVFVVEHMPAEYQPLWEMLTEERQNEIVRASRMYDFTKDGVLESFWSTQDLTKKDEKKTNENVEVGTNYHQSIFEQMMKLRNL